MDAIANWWGSLGPVNQWFYAAAFFFSAFFLWQLIAAIVGLSGDHGIDHDVTSSVDTAADHGVGDTTAAHDAAATVDVFRLLSFRSVLAFFTMFTWAGALYLNDHVPVSWALLYAFFWGLGGMVAVAGLMYMLQKATESGNLNLGTCVGGEGTVYVNIAPGGEGEVRISVGNVVQTIRARAVGGGALKSGTLIRVKRVLGPNLIEVEQA
jgi:hypothetical protein